MIETIQNFKTVGALLAFCEGSATMLTMFRDGAFCAYFDDKAQDTRIVVEWRANHCFANIRTLSEYDNEKNQWMKFGREYRLEFASKRGARACVDAYKRLADALVGYFPNILSLYRREGGAWYAC